MPAFLVLSAIILGGMTIVLSVAFHVAMIERRDSTAFHLLIASTGTMALSITIATLAGRML